MKSIIFIPLKDYFLSRKNILIKILIPILIALAALLLSIFFRYWKQRKGYINLFRLYRYADKYCSNLISFSIAIITILVSADNTNIQCLKETKSNKTQYKPVNGKQLSLFQILLSNITYNVIVEIIYLVGLIAISLIKNILPIVSLKFIVSICLFIILHILFVLLESVSQMYLTFWSIKK